MTLSIDRGEWLLRQFDTYDDETPYRFRFMGWVSLGDRHDLASIEFIDPWTGWNGRGRHRAVLAARHAGVDLRSMNDEQLPVHVHLMTSEPDLEDAQSFESGELARTAWATVEPVGADLPELPAVAVKTIRPI